MPRVFVGSTNPRLDTFVTMLDPLKSTGTSIPVVLTGTSKATFTVSNVTYTLVGSGFTVSGGKLTGGTITSVTGMTAPTHATPNLGVFQLDRMSLSVASVNTAIAAETAGDALALDRLLLDQDWQIWGNGNVNTSTVNGLTGHNIWFGSDGNDSVEGGLGYDNISGDAGNDFISGNEDNDFAFGGAGNDTLYGDAGNDNLNGDAGADTMYGGDGNDVLYGGTSTDTSTNKFWAGAGDDTITDGAGNSSIWGEAGNDKLYGGGGNDILNTQDGNDSLFGGGGVDTCYGGNGNDVLTDGAGDDILQGGANNDTITGGVGADDLYGGGGKDMFVFKTMAEMGLTTAADQIFDWETGVDKINLKSLNLTFIGSANFTTATAAAEVRYNAASARLEIDSNGDNTADAHILLATGNVVAASDLIL